MRTCYVTAHEETDLLCERSTAHRRPGIRESFIVLTLLYCTVDLQRCVDYSETCTHIVTSSPDEPQTGLPRRCGRRRFGRPRSILVFDLEPFAGALLTTRSLLLGRQSGRWSFTIISALGYNFDAARHAGAPCGPGAWKRSKILGTWSISHRRRTSESDCNQISRFISEQGLGSARHHTVPSSLLTPTNAKMNSPRTNRRRC